ncbi:MAG: dihydropteroate synthase [Deltaproteobacteria bacterium]|nr:dihydropteroate synthase [Deltaproteobacteria bacterium]
MPRFLPRLLELSTPEHAAHELRRIGVDSCGIVEMVPKMRTLCIELSQLECRQANILKQEMLSVGGDAAVARGTVSCSIGTTDCVLIGTVKQLSRLCRKLKAQPFSLPKLADELESLLARVVPAPAVWMTSRRSLSLQRPLIMGILNMTPDSFSDGGLCFDPDRAFEKALQMEAEGADIIDIGGESTRPGAAPVSPDEEIARIITVIERLAATVECAISVDTWKSGVAGRAVSAGAEIINDISGFNFDPQMPAVAAASGAGVVLMHTRGTPEKMQQDTSYPDMMGEIIAGLGASLVLAQEAGVSDDRIAIDPGIGFGKGTAGNLEILRRLGELSGFGLPILTGPSRKSFIGKVLGREQMGDRLFGTAAAIALSVSHGASILRVHDVRAMRDVADMAHAVVHS